MPVTRAKVERQEKVQEILDAATRRLLADGYEGMSVAAIARELEIAQNSVYWYFPSKDDLFAAAFREILARLASKKPPPGTAARVVWVTDQMAHFASLRAALRARAAHSAAVASLQSDLDEWVRTLLLGETGPGPRIRQPPGLAGQAFLATIEGVLSMDLPPRQRRQVITFAYQRLVGQETGPKSPLTW